ncbi:MAG: CHAT domain-containing protein, partial [Acidobacteriota bacterium]|nr:CHAT domain-containing protein [Acidobacteriota bacterium]
YYSLSRHEKAIECYEQALAIAREVKNRFGEGNALDNLSNIYSSLSNNEKAIEYLGQALTIYREIKNRAGEGNALNSLGRVHFSLIRYEKAIEYYEQALTIAREVKTRYREADVLYNLAQANLAQGNIPAAQIHIEESLKVAESIRADLLSPESRASFLANVQNSYQLHTDLLMRRHQAEPTMGFDALAVEVSERQRARSLLDLLAENGTDLRQGIAPALIEREEMLAKQLNGKAQQLTRAAKPEQIAALKREISQLENDYEQAQTAIRKASPQYAALTQTQPLKLKEIQAQLDADTLLLEYSLGKERSYLWAITRDSLTSYELPKEEEIKKNALAVYELLTARNTKKSGEIASQRKSRIADAEAKLPAATQALSDTLLAPAAAQLGNKRLVIVADGALQYIPFAILPDPAVGGRSLVSGNNQPTTNNLQPLIVGHEVVSLPSASALAIQRSELADRQPAPKMLAVIADPVFDKTDARFKTPTPETGDKAQLQTVAFADARSLEHIADESGEKGTRRVIRRLPFTQQEADGLLALAPKTSRFGATGFQANRATVLSGDLAQYRYVHFATHGLLDSERPGLSSLVLSMVDAQGKTENGFLRANDIYNMKLPAELVVLSACQTGLGKEVKGEGLIGLTRGFMYAGAKRVVVSLWSVNDKATSDLMTKFYRRMLKDNERPAAALRAAQIEMWKQKAWQSPYYWSAFVIQGEWR